MAVLASGGLVLQLLVVVVCVFELVKSSYVYTDCQKGVTQE